MVPKHVDSVIRDTSDYAPKVRKVIGLCSSFVCEFIQSMIVMSSNMSGSYCSTNLMPKRQEVIGVRDVARGLNSFVQYLEYILAISHVGKGNVGAMLSELPNQGEGMASCNDLCSDVSTVTINPTLSNNCRLDFSIGS